MKIFHLADLHLGKKVNGFSMTEDQTHILSEVLASVEKEKPAAIIIAGDVYDKGIPTIEAVQLFDDFLCKLVELGIKVFVVSGNHDSAERISFGSRLMTLSGVHFSKCYDGSAECISLEDDFGKLNFYLLPFVKPATVRPFFEDEEISSYTDAIRAAVNRMNINPSERNILISHQFVTGAIQSDSEEKCIGGLDNVDASVFEPFDYVALGHIHRPQKIQKDTIRYSGSPLKYSFSEASHNKSITVIDFAEKGSLELSFIPLVPLHDLREIKGSYEELTFRPNYENTAVDDYLHITLTDEMDVPDVLGKLRIIYPNIMKLDYENSRTKAAENLSAESMPEKKAPLELVQEFYENRNGRPMTEEQFSFVKEIAEKLQEGEK